MDIFSYTFMHRAFIAGIIVGTLCAIIGVYVVLKGMSFIGAGISHASFGGVAIGLLLKVNPLFTAIIFCILTSIGINIISRKAEIKEDTAVGIFFSASMAFGVLLIGFIKGYSIDIFGYLFGSILAVKKEDLIFMALMALIVLLIVTAFYRELKYVCFDQEMSMVVGIPVERINLLLFTIIALTIVVSIKVVGIILVSALLIIPSATAYQMTENYNRMIILSVVMGIISTLGGLVISYYLNTASGATIVLLATVLFFMVMIVSPRRKSLPRLLRS